MKGNSRIRMDFSAVDLPSPRPQSHSPHPGPVGSQVSSPAHHLLPRPHLNPHLSHPDLTSPRRGMSPVEYNLAALASISGAMERPKSSGLSGSSSSVGGAGSGAFTLADLITSLGLGSQSVSPIPGSSQPILRSRINTAGLLSQPGSAQPR